ncbi:MAG: hypothetical protein MI923_12935 [Phycisphaerales bacterium]|nr:hypothetical protein [Phycisphaerales bacterium]
MSDLTNLAGNTQVVHGADWPNRSSSELGFHPAGEPRGPIGDSRRGRVCMVQAAFCRAPIVPFPASRSVDLCSTCGRDRGTGPSAAVPSQPQRTV